MRGRSPAARRPRRRSPRAAPSASDIRRAPALTTPTSRPVRDRPRARRRRAPARGRCRRFLTSRPGRGGAARAPSTPPGTYTFHCDLHNFMTATIVVQPSTTTSTTRSTTSSTSTTQTTSTGTTSTTQSTTTPTTSTSTTTTSGSGSTPAPPPPGPPRHHGSPLAGSAARAITVASRQRGATVHGTVRISAAGAGGRLEVKLWASREQLLVGAGARRPVPRLVRVGTWSAPRCATGRVRFALRLDGAARRALRRHGRLRVTISLALASAAGDRVSTSRRVVLRP